MDESLQEKKPYCCSDRLPCVPVVSIAPFLFSFCLMCVVSLFFPRVSFRRKKKEEKGVAAPVKEEKVSRAKRWLGTLVLVTFCLF